MGLESKFPIFINGIKNGNVYVYVHIKYHSYSEVLQWYKKEMEFGMETLFVGWSPTGWSPCPVFLTFSLNSNSFLILFFCHLMVNYTNITIYNEMITEIIKHIQYLIHFYVSWIRCLDWPLVG